MLCGADIYSPSVITRRVIVLLFAHVGTLPEYNMNNANLSCPILKRFASVSRNYCQIKIHSLAANHPCRILQFSLQISHFIRTAFFMKIVCAFFAGPQPFKCLGRLNRGIFEKQLFSMQVYSDTMEIIIIHK